VGQPQGGSRLRSIQ